jgi:acetyl-CoA/propionyl-CoA carboxylase biotin carboxyl carrier protein
VDSGVAAGDVISAKFDSMMGKLIVTAQSRAAAIARVVRALEELEIDGVPTPKNLFEKIFTDPDFVAADGTFSVTTKWLEKKYLTVAPESTRSGQPASLTAGEGSIAEERDDNEPFVIEIDNKRVSLSLPPELFAGAVSKGHKTKPLSQPLRGQGSRVTADASHAAPGADGDISSPMQAVVTRVCVAPDQAVAKGDLLIVLESMKMENYVYSPLDGHIKEILVGPAQGVDAGETLVRLATVELDEKKDAAKEEEK